MYFKFGSHQHPDNEVNLSSFTQRRIRSPRGKQQIIRKRMDLEGVLLPSSATQAQIKTSINALESAYATGNKDAGLYHDDDTVSPHFLDTSASINGVQVVQVDFPTGDGAEYATQRTFRIVLEADFPVDSLDNLLTWQESLSFQGLAGPKFAYKLTANGPPQRQQIHQRTTQTINQSGAAVGYLSRPSPSAPLFPSIEHTDQRNITSDSPTLDGRQFIDWPVRWSYVFESDQALAGSPRAL